MKRKQSSSNNKKKTAKYPRPNTKPTRQNTGEAISTEPVVATVGPLKLGHAGCAASTADGKRYSVTAAVPGDQMLIAPLPSQGPPAARVIEVTSPSKARREAPCVLLNRCGACTLQAMNYPEQLAAKHKALQRALAPLGLEGVDVAPVIGLRQPFGYRTRLLMQASPGHKGRGFRLGFYKRGSTDMVSATGCPVQHPLTLAVVGMVRQVLADAPINASTPQSRHGWLHGVGVRVDPTTNLAELTLAGRTDTIPGKNVAERLALLPVIGGVHIAVNRARSSYLYGDTFKHLSGRKRMIFNLGGEEFHLSPGAFFQTCAEGAERLVERVLALLPEQIETLADLYGGVGVFARVSAPRWKRAMVVESNTHAVGDLRSYIQHSKHPDLTCVEGLVERSMGRVREANPDVVVIDPPRGGCHPRVIEGLGKSKPHTIVYVACGIDALVRDGEMLQKYGYRVDKVESVDMFPHTTHLEVVARFVL